MVTASYFQYQDLSEFLVTAGKHNFAIPRRDSFSLSGRLEPQPERPVNAWRPARSCRVSGGHSSNHRLTQRTEGKRRRLGGVGGDDRHSFSRASRRPQGGDAVDQGFEIARFAADFLGDVMKVR